MQKPTFVLLMTACISPPDYNKDLVRTDPVTRLNDYINAFKFWLNLEEPKIGAIVFAENSGYTLDALKQVAATCNRYNRTIEFLQFPATQTPPTVHYGFSELEMIDNAYHHSKLIKNADYIIKVTGRLYFPRLSRLLNIVQPNHLFISDSRDFDLFNKSQHYAVTTIFVVQTGFYGTVLYNVKQQMGAGKFGLIEDLYFHILKPLYLKNKTDIILRLPFNVEPVGVGAHWNVSYRSYKKQIPAFLRGLGRIFYRKLWI